MWDELLHFIIDKVYKRKNAKLKLNSFIINQAAFFKW